MWQMVVECPDCHSRSFVAAVVDEAKADDARDHLRRLAGEHMVDAAFPEITEQDVRVPMEPLIDQDVEDMRTFLETFNGDFKSLFAK